MNFKMVFITSGFLLIFSSALGFGIPVTVLDLDEITSDSNSQNRADIATIDNHLFGLTSESKISISGHYSVNLVPDQHFLKFFTTIDALEVLSQIQLKHYSNLYNNCLIHYRKSDLIFPFHYFW